MQREKSHAVVIGGSMAGLLAARILSDHFDAVTVFERDDYSVSPEFRRGVPQGRHAHALLLRGQRTLFRLLPTMKTDLLEAGARSLNMGRDMRWFHFGVWKRRYDSRLEGLFASRPLLEWTIGEYVRRLPNVRVLNGCSVEGLNFEADRVAGVHVRARGDSTDAQLARADLVIDAAGRASRTPAELAQRGFARPRETAVKINIGYATRIFRIPDAPRDWQVLYVISQPPEKRGGLILPLEGGRWMVTLVGRHGDHPPTDDAAGWLAFAKSLPVPDMYEALKHAEPLGDIMRYGYAASQRRHYEKLRRFPRRLLVLGDALCSFNPVYGQGMSAASMYADALDECLRSCGGRLDEIWRPFFSRTARVADMPWQLSTGEDFRFPETIGPRSPMLRFMHWYTSKVQVACGHDALVTERLYEIMHLLKPPAAVFRPDVVWRLIRPRVREVDLADEALAMPRA